MKTKTPSAVDRHVGARIRMRRMQIRMSQEKLGEAVGITFQQIQKYEKGTNRVGSSRLQQIADALGASPAFFFENAPRADQAECGAETVTEADMLTAEGLRVLRHFHAIRSQHTRSGIARLLEHLAKDPERNARPDIDPEVIARLAGDPLAEPRMPFTDSAA